MLEQSGSRDENIGLNQWYLVNEGQEIDGKLGIMNEDINFSNTLNISTDQKTVVAIIDNGVNFTLTNIQHSRYINDGEIPNNHVDDDNNGYIDDISGWDFVNNDSTQYDENINAYHGTSVINVMIGQDTEEYLPLIENVEVLSLKVFENEQFTVSSIIEAIQYAENMGSSVVLMSFELLSFNQELYDVMSNSTMFFVCSAGNSRIAVSYYPASFELDNMIVVGGLNNRGYPSGSTNYGAQVDIYAPAENIYSIDDNGNYGYYSGTSYAVPQVAALVVYLSELKELNGIELKNEVMQYTRISTRAILAGEYLIILDLSHIYQAQDD